MYIDLEKFQKVYYEKVKPLEEDFEFQKLNVRIKIAFIIILAIVIDICILLSKPIIGENNVEIFMYVIFGGFILSQVIIHNFINKAKKIIFPELIKSVDSNLTYQINAKIPKNEFIDSDLYNSIRNYRYSVGDTITTNIDNKEITINELSVEVSNGKNSTTVFAGVFLHIKLQKNFRSNIKILNNTTKDFGIIKTLFPNEDKVNLENIEFENKYDVYSSDQIYARKIITLTFMEKLLYIAEKLDKKIKISFKNNDIYIAILELNLINDSNLFKNKIDMMNIAKEMNNILEIIHTIDYLDLDV